MTSTRRVRLLEWVRCTFEFFCFQKLILFFDRSLKHSNNCAMKSTNGLVKSLQRDRCVLREVPCHFIFKFHVCGYYKTIIPIDIIKLFFIVEKWTKATGLVSNSVAARVSWGKERYYRISCWNRLIFGYWWPQLLTPRWNPT